MFCINCKQERDISEFNFSSFGNMVICKQCEKVKKIKRNLNKTTYTPKYNIDNTPDTYVFRNKNENSSLCDYQTY